MKPFTCAIVGATGMVGGMFIEILEERKLPVSRLHLFASARSAGKEVLFNGQAIEVKELSPSVFERGMDAVLFAANEKISLENAPIATRKGSIVVDNSSAWRMNPAVPLVVPEVNGKEVNKNKRIIANPNCCAVPAVVALKPLSDAYGLKRVVISTYQSVSGSGWDGIRDMNATMQGKERMFYPHNIANNVIPHIGSFDENGYTGEETKLMEEIKKILHLPKLNIAATTVRIPIYYSHSLSINVTLKKPFAMEELRRILENAPGAVLYDDPSANMYPMPSVATGNDNVYVGRLREDTSHKNSLNMWVVADNTRKGAATNAVQILEKALEAKNAEPYDE